jgi:hypothetical protein
MPSELKRLRMLDSAMTVAEFIDSRPSASRPFLIAAVSDCLRRHCELNEAELQIAARAIRYAS